MKPTCYKCYDAAPSCDACGSTWKGYSRCFEEPENAKELLAAVTDASTNPAHEEPNGGAAEDETVDTHWIAAGMKKLRKAHDRGVRTLVRVLESIPREESVEVLRQLVFERVATCIADEMCQDSNDLYDREFDEYVSFNPDDLSININGSLFKFCMLPAHIADSLTNAPVEEPPKKKQRKSKD
jgi:hypothetical protein